jgi:hypothetical protein
MNNTDSREAIYNIRKRFILLTIAYRQKELIPPNQLDLAGLGVV